MSRPGRALAVAVVAFLLSTPACCAIAQTPSPSPTLDPSRLKPPGIQSPLVGVAAVIAIVIAAAAGLWVYRVIRKGL